MNFPEDFVSCTIQHGIESVFCNLGRIFISFVYKWRHVRDCWNYAPRAQKLPVGRFLFIHFSFDTELIRKFSYFAYYTIIFCASCSPYCLTYGIIVILQTTIGTYRDKSIKSLQTTPCIPWSLRRRRFAKKSHQADARIKVLLVASAIAITIR